MRALTVDQAANSGWCAGSDKSNEPFAFGSFRMPKRDVIGERLVIFRDGLVDIIETHKPDVIAMETPYMPMGQTKPRFDGDKRAGNSTFNPKTIRFLANIEGILKEVAARYALELEEFPSSSWRVTALGFGRLPKGSTQDFKKLMMARARALGYAVKNDNEADAIGMMLHLLHGPPASLRAQGDLLSRVADL